MNSSCRKHIEVVVSYRGKEKLYTYEEWVIVGEALINKLSLIHI